MSDFTTKQDISDYTDYMQRPGFDRNHYMLIDEISTTLYYIGWSKNGTNAGKPIWRIKKIWKAGTVWHFGFPNGDEDFKYTWNIRPTYIYR